MRRKRSLKNITLSAEGDVIEKARSKASMQKTTLNEVFREWLVNYIDEGSPGGAYRALMDRLKSVNPGRKFSRHEMNER